MQAAVQGPGPTTTIVAAAIRPRQSLPGLGYGRRLGLLGREARVGIAVAGGPETVSAV